MPSSYSKKSIWKAFTFIQSKPTVFIRSLGETLAWRDNLVGIFKIRPKYTYYINLLSMVSEPTRNKRDNLVWNYYAVKPCLIQYGITSGISDPLRLTYWT